ncbi:oligosaccharide flippase family protein [Pseudoalteromonas rubra]|uniref:oligosaccharide flippase family protein n=1 Tax=Pseudoalteromonas rubra TaxID=43658 RepID=UPI000F765FF6|nr:oligosaccharide flippase family protein [Pseudoalteromonas rubra]
MTHPTSTMRTLLSNTSYLIGAEVVAKASRLISIMAMAACLSATEYGTAMLALTVHEVLRLLLRSGAGAQVIRASDDELPAFLKNGRLLQWLLCVALCLVQILVALTSSWLFPGQDMTVLIALMALTYLVFPLVCNQVFLMQRRNQMGLFGLISSVCIITENLALAAALYLDAGLLAVVIGKWAFTILWLGCFAFVPTSAMTGQFSKVVFTRLLKASTQLAGSEILRSLRVNMDMFVAARLLSPELFGLYSFAKSVGVGLAISVAQAYTTALYPFVCKLKNAGNFGSRHSQLLLAITTAVSAIFIVQAMLVPWYVPVLFTEHWQGSFTTSALLCLIATSTVWTDSYAVMQRANGRFARECQLNAYCLLISLAGLLMLQPDQPVLLAAVLVSCSALWLLFPLADFALRRCDVGAAKSSS